MRIVAGQARGKKLEVPDGVDVRPTPDRVREALFSHLWPDLPGTRVLDAFAGSGALGLEALSRGAASAVFIELSKAHLSALARNINGARFSERAQVICADTVSQLGVLAAKGDAFDFIFLDPPYQSTLLGESLIAIAATGLLRPEGRIIAEHPKLIIPILPKGLQFIRTRTYGITSISTIASHIDPESVESLPRQKAASS